MTSILSECILFMIFLHYQLIYSEKVKTQDLHVHKYVARLVQECASLIIVDITENTELPL